LVEWARCGETIDCVVEDRRVSRREYVLSHTKLSMTSAFLLLLAFIYATKSSIAQEKRLAQAKDKVNVGLINSVMQAENEPTPSSDGGAN